jgi:hypothetical protein
MRTAPSTGKVFRPFWKKENRRFEPLTPLTYFIFRP